MVFFCFRVVGSLQCILRIICSGKFNRYIVSFLGVVLVTFVCLYSFQEMRVHISPVLKERRKLKVLVIVSKF